MKVKFMLAESYHRLMNDVQEFANDHANELMGETALRYTEILDYDWTPSYGSERAAGADLRTIMSVCLAPGQTVDLPTGIHFEIPEGVEGHIRSRSGLWFKYRLKGFAGTIDSDYRGELMVSLTNMDDKSHSVFAGERVAQIVFSKYEKGDFQETGDLDETGRGVGGFGSTGKV